MNNKNTQIYKIPPFLKTRPRTKIVCTLGPATATVEKIKQLIRSGMSVARLNLSHGSEKEHLSLIANSRLAAKELDVPIGILADLPGPKYRIGDFKEKVITVPTGNDFIFSSDFIDTNIPTVNIWPDGFSRDIRKGAKILIDEGSIEMRVTGIDGDNIRCKVISGGLIKSNKSVTSPGHTSKVNYFSPETIKAIEFVKSSDVDFVGLSYIRNSKDLTDIKKQLGSKVDEIRLVAKIEIREAVDNLKEMLLNSDAVMVARGDLGVEIPFQKVPSVQKKIIDLANRFGKPVITATQMMDSMIQNPNPTRAEVTDVHNAVLDGTDALMLSGETSIGKNPVKTVKAMAKIAKLSEKFLDKSVISNRRENKSRRGQGLGVDDAIAKSACNLSNSVKAKAVLAFTESGSTAARVSNFRPNAPIIALCSQSSTSINLSLHWGVIPIEVKSFNSVQHMFWEGSRIVIDTGIAKFGDFIVVVLGLPIGYPGSTNLLRVIKIPESERDGTQAKSTIS